MSKKDHSKCRSLLVFLSDFVDGNLSEELCQEIECHVAECQDCRIVVDTLRRTISLYHECAGEPAEFLARYVPICTKPLIWRNTSKTKCLYCAPDLPEIIGEEFDFQPA